MTQTVSLKQVLAFRLARSLRPALSVPASSVVDAAAYLCGVQSQLPQAAEWALQTRKPDATRDDLQTALYETQHLVKSWLMRGTVHLVPSAELDRYLAAIGPSAETETLRWLTSLGFTSSAVQQLADLIAQTVQAQPLTRKALADAVQAHGARLRELVEHGWGGVVKLAALQGHVCFGPPMGQEITFVSRAAWLGASSSHPARNEALAWLLRRYLTCYGPATPLDFSHWSGISAALSRLAFAEAELLPVALPDGQAWLLAEDEQALRSARLNRDAVLLDCFDPLTLAHAKKNWLVESIHQTLVYRKAGWVSAISLIDGSVRGTWSKTRKGRMTQIVIAPFKPLSATQCSRLERMTLQRIPDPAVSFTESG